MSTHETSVSGVRGRRVSLVLCALRFPGSLRLARLLAAVVWIPVLWVPGAVALAHAPTPEVARREGAAGTTVNRIAAVRRQTDQARSTVLARRNQILAVRDRLVDPTSALAASREQVQSAIDARLTGIFRVDRLPLWSPQVRESLRAEWSAGGTHFRRTRENFSKSR